MTWYIKAIESNFLKSFPKFNFEFHFRNWFPKLTFDNDPANHYPEIMIYTIVGVALFFAIFIWWLERKSGRDDRP